MKKEFMFQFQVKTTCTPGDFRCTDGSCIPVLWQCDGEPECPDGLDEWDHLCSEFLIHIKIGLFSQTYNLPEEKARCTNDHYRCDIDGTCIPSSWLCDDQNDCEDGSDEIECSKNGPILKRSLL